MQRRGQSVHELRKFAGLPEPHQEAVRGEPCRAPRPDGGTQPGAAGRERGQPQEVAGYQRGERSVEGKGGGTPAGACVLNYRPRSSNSKRGWRTFEQLKNEVADAKQELAETKSELEAGDVPETHGPSRTFRPRTLARRERRSRVSHLFSCSASEEGEEEAEGQEEEAEGQEEGGEAAEEGGREAKAEAKGKGAGPGHGWCCVKPERRADAETSSSST